MEHLKCPSMIKKNFVALPNYKQKNKKELLFLQQKNLIEISQNMILINKIKKVPKKISKYQLQLKLQKNNLKILLRRIFMLIHVRNAAHELQIKDILDINFDMK